MDLRKAAIFDLPAYTTVLAQVFSPDGTLFAAGSDSGKIAVFRTQYLVSGSREDSSKKVNSKGSPCHHFRFAVGSCSNDEAEGSRWSVLDMASTQDCLVASVSDLSRSCLLAYPWKRLEKKRADVLWKIDQGSFSQLPIDINSIAVDEESSTKGRLFLGGGGPPVNQITNKADNSIKTIDIETRLESRSPMMGHENYIHSLNFCPKSNRLLSASEDGSARLWDARTKSGQISVVKPFEHESLKRPKLGKWVGAASLSGDWFAVGGGPRPAIWHLRTLSPMDPYLPPNGSALESSSLGGVHVLKIVDEEQKVIIGGEFGGNVFMADLGSRRVTADIPTSCGCTTYSAAYQVSPYKVMCIAGSGSNIDLCTANFSYKDRAITFPS